MLVNSSNCTLKKQPPWDGGWQRLQRYLQHILKFLYFLILHPVLCVVGFHTDGYVVLGASLLTEISRGQVSAIARQQATPKN